MDPVGLGYEALPKALWYIAVQLAVGVSTARWLLARAQATAPHAPDAAGESRLAMVAMAAGGAAVVALALRLWGHTAAAFGADGAWLAENLRTIAIESRWGWAWRVQLGAGLLLVGSGLWSRFRRRGAWNAFALASALCCAATPLLGHAAGSASRVPMHGAHVAASGAWVGTLTVIVALHLMSAGRLRGGKVERTALVVEQFSPVALTTAGVVLVTGVFSAVIYVGSLEALGGSDYGRALLVKLALVLGVLGCGFFNWRRSCSGGMPRVWLMATETALAWLVVIATAVLTETEQP